MVMVRSPGHVYLCDNDIFIIIIIIIGTIPGYGYYYYYRYTCTHDIIYTIPMIYNDALLLLIIAQSVNYSQVHYDCL